MINLKFICVLLVMMCIICGVHYYLARCIHHCVKDCFPKIRIAYIIILLALLTVMMLLSIARPFSGAPQRIISTLGTVWMGLFVYLLLYFLASDLICLISRLIPGAPQRLLLVTRLSAIALAFATVIGGLIHSSKIYTVNYSVSLSENAASEMTVVMLSDLHIGAVNSESRLERIVDRINEQKPDLVCIAGDIFDNDYSAIVDPEGAIATLKRISAAHGVYACLGNHDAGAEFEKMTAFLEKADVKLLDDEYVVIDDALILAGRLDPSPIGVSVEKGRQPLETVLEGADPELPVIVMDHNPSSIDSYKGEGQLVLSGHTHRGQIFPGNFITDAMYTVDYGYYKAESGTQMIVTSGAGTWGLPIRVGTNCEIVNVNLKY